MSKTPALDIANASGFPLQIAVENLLRKTEGDHHWKIKFREHAWVNQQDGNQGFIDLVLENSPETSLLVVECKRVRDSSWIFLPSDGSTKHRRHVNSFVSWYDGGALRVYGWHDLAGEPGCPEAMFCAIRGQESSPQRAMLERVGGDLVSATEALARELRDFRAVHTPTLKIYTNVIVTTAALKVAKFNPESISLSEGTLAEAEFEEVPFVRFRKQLGARPRLLTPDDYSGDSRAKALEHTVFVINAEALADFLGAFEFDNGPVNRLCRM